MSVQTIISNVCISVCKSVIFMNCYKLIDIILISGIRPNQSNSSLLGTEQSHDVILKGKKNKEKCYGKVKINSFKNTIKSPSKI